MSKEFRTLLFQGYKSYRQTVLTYSLHIHRVCAKEPLNMPLGKGLLLQSCSQHENSVSVNVWNYFIQKNNANASALHKWDLQKCMKHPRNCLGLLFYCPIQLYWWEYVYICEGGGIVPSQYEELSFLRKWLENCQKIHLAFDRKKQTNCKTATNNLAHFYEVSKHNFIS